MADCYSWIDSCIDLRLDSQNIDFSNSYFYTYFMILFKTRPNRWRKICIQVNLLSAINML